MALFADAALAGRLERAEGSAGAAFVEARGEDSCWARIGGAYAMFDGADSPLTQTFALGMSEPAEGSVFAEIENFFQKNQAPVQHEVCPLAGVALSRFLAERGYVPIEMSNVLFLETAESRRETVLSRELSVRTAGSGDADVYSHAAGEGWREAGDVAPLIAGLTRIMSAARGYVGFLVEKQGQVVATAGLVINDGVALFAGASTIPEARGQGAQQVLLEARLRHAAEEKCDLAMIVTEPGSGSQRNAERAGFRIAYTRTKWRLHRPASSRDFA
jgi:GNAT superfamily N-acetyltransferase